MLFLEDMGNNALASALPGRYVLGGLLGRGGMAEVFAGHAHGSHGFQKPVAIKRLLPEHANDIGFVERLIGEAKLLVGMLHSNVVCVLDLAREGRDVFLVMEYVDGPSLRQLMKAHLREPFSLGIATYIAQEAATGLAFAHTRRGGAIIHADVSPGNLLLTSSGEVRVADFGIARREGGGEGVVEGNCAYMAPEQVRGGKLTPRTDVFSLGIVLYELITGRHPLGVRVTLDERGINAPRIVPPRIVNPEVPPALDALVMRALAARPEDRFARMQDMIDALVDQRFANGWRESAAELAQLIREVPTLVGTQPTQHTGGPVTIVTCSLIEDELPVLRVGPRSRASSPSPWRPIAATANGTATIPDAPPVTMLIGPGELEALLRDSTVLSEPRTLAHGSAASVLPGPDLDEQPTMHVLLPRRAPLPPPRRPVLPPPPMPALVPDLFVPPRKPSWPSVRKLAMIAGPIAFGVIVGLLVTQLEGPPPAPVAAPAGESLPAPTGQLDEPTLDLEPIAEPALVIEPTPEQEIVITDEDIDAVVVEPPVRKLLRTRHPRGR